MKDTDDDLPIKASRTANHCNYSLQFCTFHASHALKSLSDSSLYMYMYITVHNYFFQHKISSELYNNVIVWS